MTVLTMGIAASSCSDDSCYDNGSSLPLATCYVGNSQQTIGGLTIKGIGALGDSLLLDSAAVKEVYLPLRATVGTTSYVLSRWLTTDTVTTLYSDTLTLDYEPIEYFHSVECGAMYNFDIKRVTCTKHAIDSVVLLTNHVTNSPAPALRIHFAQ